jgi:Rad3-related DNA helicase
MTRVVQAAGRLIRSAEDSGVIALFDRRFLDHPYVDRLPAAWLGDDGDAAALAGDPAAAAREFFALRRD